MRYRDVISKIKKIPNIKTIGTSILNAPIYCAHIGKFCGKQILIESGIHGREYISIFVNYELYKYYKNRLLPFGIYFIFNSNPDGTRLCIDGINFVKQKSIKKELLRINKFNYDFSQWKANIKGVDLNVNFNALWGKGNNNTTVPSAQNYIGPHPNSEKETKTLIEYLLCTKLDCVIALHSKGNVIYWGYENSTAESQEKDKKFAQAIANTIGYNLEKLNKSVGGLTDWVSEQLKVPALTIELGEDSLSHPISPKYSKYIFNTIKTFPIIIYQLL